MRHRSRTFSLSKSQFNLLFLHLRELYCEVLERGTARQVHPLCDCRRAAD